MPNYKDIKYQFPAESLVSGSVANARISSGSVTQHVQPYISWQSVTTSGITMVAGRGYPVDTSGGAITMTMPASPSVGDIVAFKDYLGTWAESSKQVTLLRNGSKIKGVCGCAVLNTRNQSVTLIYVDGTQGWLDIHDSEAGVTGTIPYNVQYKKSLRNKIYIYDTWN